MLNYLVLNNEAGDQSKGKYTRSREGVLVGDIQGWNMLFDPKYLNEQGDVKNRVERNTFIKSLSPYTVKQGGDSALLSTSESIKGRFQPDLDINVREWTVFFVCRPIGIEGSVPHGIFRTIQREINDAEQKGMNISFLTSGGVLRIYRNGSGNPGGSINAVLSAEVPVASVGKLAAYVVTFSIENGYRVYCNGALIGSSANKDPINFGYKGGEWEIYPDFAGDVGLSGLIAADMSLSENTFKRNNLFKMLNERYAIY